MSATHRQRGVALLVVLILLVMMAALAAKISQQFCRNLQKTHYQVSQQQLLWAIARQQQAAQALLTTYATGESAALSPEGEWAQPLETKGDNFTVVSQLEDAQDCFNVNSLLAPEKAPVVSEPGARPEKPLREQILEQLLVDGGLTTVAAEEVYQQLLDELDSDSTTATGEQESDRLAGMTPPRHPANQMMRLPNEIARLPAFPRAAWPAVSKLLCALPDVSGKVNVNTLKPEQAVLLSALLKNALSEEEAKRLLASRPEGGWESVEAFSKALETAFPQSAAILPQVQEYIAVNSRYFRFSSTGNTDDLTLRVVSELQVDPEAGKVITWQRRYRMVE